MDEEKSVDEFVKEAIDSMAKAILVLSICAEALKKSIEKEKQKPKKKVRQPPKYV